MSQRALEAARDALFRELVALANGCFDVQVAAEDLTPHHERLDKFERPLSRVEALVLTLRGQYERTMTRRGQIDALEALERSRNHHHSQERQ